MTKKEYYKKYYQEHKIELNEYKKEYDKKHNKKVRKNQRKYWKVHAKNKKEHNRKYYLKNTKKILKQSKKYRLKNKKRLSKQKTIYMYNRRKIDNNFRLIGNLRHRLNIVLKNNVKSKNTLKLLGCSLKFLRKYLESQFKDGMSWNNYGKWHVDHIKPCASFDLSKVSEQRKCFNYKNLQPLWAKDNLSKNKY